MRPNRIVSGDWATNRHVNRQAVTMHVAAAAICAADSRILLEPAPAGALRRAACGDFRQQAQARWKRRTPLRHELHEELIIEPVVTGR